jgi:hypothetical protein
MGKFSKPKTSIRENSNYVKTIWKLQIETKFLKWYSTITNDRKVPQAITKSINENLDFIEAIQNLQTRYQVLHMIFNICKCWENTPN